jgi:hypothetical protein
MKPIDVRASTVPFGSAQGLLASAVRSKRRHASYSDRISLQARGMAYRYAFLRHNVSPKRTD